MKHPSWNLTTILGNFTHNYSQIVSKVVKTLLSKKFVSKISISESIDVFVFADNVFYLQAKTNNLIMIYNNGIALINNYLFGPCMPGKVT